MIANPVVIVSAARTPIGAFQGAFISLSAAQLGAVAISAALARTPLAPDQIDECIMGCVLAAGQGQAPARQAALGADLPVSVACTTVNKMCGSGMRAAMFAHDMLVAGSANIMIAGGMESMSQAPYLLPKARAGLRMGHSTVVDHMFYDGLEDAYSRDARGGRRLMGVFADDCARSAGLTREAQDAFALASLQRARTANEPGGAFDWEMAPVTVTSRHGSQLVARDEQPFKVDPDKIVTLKPAFSEAGTVTAANASSISDGAAALVMMRALTAQQLGIAPLARIVGHSTFAQNPADFPTAPIGVLTTLFQQTGWRAADVDLYEINEAFAVVALAAMQAHHLPHEKVNIYGGACALGHPIGASGARIIVTLINALRRRSCKRGVASLCIGGGEATACAIELCE